MKNYLLFYGNDDCNVDDYDILYIANKRQSYRRLL